MSELVIPVSYHTLHQASFTIDTFDYDRQRLFYIRHDEIAVPSGHFTSVQELLDLLNEQVRLFWDKKLDQLKSKWAEMVGPQRLSQEDVNKARKRIEAGHECVHFELVNGRVELQMDHSLAFNVTMTENLQFTLGFDQPTLRHRTEVGQKHEAGRTTLTAKHGADIRSGTDFFFIYCDLIAPQLIGHTKAQVIKVVPATGAYGSISDHLFHTVHYCDLLRNRFDSVRIHIYTSAGTPVPFDFGKTIIKLHFRRKRLM